MKENDLIIEGLLKKVEEKRAEIEVIKSPQFKTNMSLCFDITKSVGREIFNIHMLDENNLLLLLGRTTLLQNSISNACLSYNLDDTFILHGYPLTDWRDDLLLKLRMVQSKRKLIELSIIEVKLNNLMSSDKKESIELVKLAKLLGL